MKTVRQANVLSNQVALTDSAYVELTGYSNSLTIYTDTEAVYVSVGYDTPADGTAFKVPANASLELKPVPTGKVAIKSVSGAQTVYVLGS